MKFRQKKNTKTTLSEKIADALTVKPRADIEDDQVFGTKPRTISRADFSSSDSEDDAAISDFRKRTVNLLSDISKKYKGEVVSRNETAEDESEESDSENEISAHNITLEDQDDSLEDSEDSFRLEKPQPRQKSKQNQGTDSEDLPSDAESDDYSITKIQKQINGVSESDDEEADDDDESNNDGKEDGTGYDISEMAEPIKEDFEHVKKENVSEEAKKGSCVRNQLLIWEGLLEMRIHLQRCVNTANQMPLPDTFEDLKQNNEFVEDCTTSKANIANVLDKMLILQNLLFTKYPETKSISMKKVGTNEKQNKESDEEIPSDTDNEEIPSDTEPEDEPEKEHTKVTKVRATTGKKRKLEDYEIDISKSHKAFKSFRDATIQKWNDKTRLATATSIKNAPPNTILQQISYILSDREKLVKRTQLKRSEYDIIGYKKIEFDEENKDQNGEEYLGTRDRKENDEYIPEIFDDSDFYHQLLRELIECKSADISDPVQLSRQWIALQQMRSKMKRKVDTKATKGRKIKYVVHNKLVNYMAPEKCTTWTDESTIELYSSLFGKMFEHNNVGMNANLENGFNIK